VSHFLLFAALVSCAHTNTTKPWEVIRRTLFSGALATGISLSGSSFPSFASDTTSLPVVTQKAYLDIGVLQDPRETVTIGIYGNEAPGASKVWTSICKGDRYPSGDGQMISFDGSQVSRISKDQRVVFGKFSRGSTLKRQVLAVQPPHSYLPLLHTLPYLLSPSFPQNRP
jgi:hypothetical protein